MNQGLGNFDQNSNGQSWTFLMDVHMDVQGLEECCISNKKASISSAFKRYH